MTHAPREAACQARESLHKRLDNALHYRTKTLKQAIDDACFYGRVKPTTAIKMHHARRKMNAIIDAKPGGNGSKKPNRDDGWRFYLQDTKKKQKKNHAPRHTASQTRAILHAKLDRRLGHPTPNLYVAIQDAYHSSIILKEETRVSLHVARENMNAIVHDRSGTAPKRTWRYYYASTKPAKLGKRKKTK